MAGEHPIDRGHGALDEPPESDLQLGELAHRAEPTESKAGVQDTCHHRGHLDRCEHRDPADVLDISTVERPPRLAHEHQPRPPRGVEPTEGLEPEVAGAPQHAENGLAGPGRCDDRVRPTSAPIDDDSR